MKVVHFLPHFPGREGTTSYCRGLCEALNKLQPETAEIWSYKHQSKDEKLPVLNFTGHRRHPFDLPKELRQCLVDRRDEISGVILHGTFNPPMAAMGRFLRKLEIPYVFIPHDPYVTELMSHGWLKKRVYWHFFEKRLLTKAVGVLLLSKLHVEPLQRLGFRGKTEVIPNGCNPEVEFFPRVSKEKHEPKVIQYLGRMDRNHKGLDLLIDGFGQFSTKVGKEKVVLMLSGNDWFDRAELEKRVLDLGLQKQIVFTGARSESSAEIFSKADLAVLVSRFDGFGLTLVEAMLAGCPVLVTETCGVSSHVQEGDTGWVVAAEVEAIAQGFEKAWSERDGWELRGRQAREFVLNKLTWEQAASKSLEVYQSWFNKRESKVGL